MRQWKNLDTGAISRGFCETSCAFSRAQCGQSSHDRWVFNFVTFQSVRTVTWVDGDTLALRYGFSALLTISHAPYENGLVRFVLLFLFLARFFFYTMAFETWLWNGHLRIRAASTKHKTDRSGSWCLRCTFGSIAVNKSNYTSSSGSLETKCNRNRFNLGRLIYAFVQLFWQEICNWNARLA